MSISSLSFLKCAINLSCMLVCLLLVSLSIKKASYYRLISRHCSIIFCKYSFLLKKSAEFVWPNPSLIINLSLPLFSSASSLTFASSSNWHTHGLNVQIPIWIYFLWDLSNADRQNIILDNKVRSRQKKFFNLCFAIAVTIGLFAVQVIKFRHSEGL